jgi:hypothetical protein
VEVLELSPVAVKSNRLAPSRVAEMHSKATARDRLEPDPMGGRERRRLCSWCDPHRPEVRQSSSTLERVRRPCSAMARFTASGTGW